MPQRRLHLLVAALIALSVTSTGGCAQRQLTSAPGTPPSAATWALVGMTAVVMSVVVGILIALPVWQHRRGARFAAALLSVEAGGVVVGMVTAIAVVIRSWQLQDHPVDEPPLASLVRLSRLETDTGLVILVVIAVLVGGVLLVALLAAAARLAATDAAAHRVVVCTLLCLQLVGGGFAIAMVAGGLRSWPYLLGVALVPLIVVALLDAWPRPVPARLPDAAASPS